MRASSASSEASQVQRGPKGKWNFGFNSSDLVYYAIPVLNNNYEYNGERVYAVYNPIYILIPAALRRLREEVQNTKVTKRQKDLRNTRSASMTQ